MFTLNKRYNNTRTGKSDKLSIRLRSKKKIARQDKINFKNELALVAEKVSNARSNKTLHHINKQLCYRPHTSNIPIKDTNGKPLLTAEEQTFRWTDTLVSY